MPTETGYGSYGNIHYGYDDGTPVLPRISNLILDGKQCDCDAPPETIGCNDLSSDGWYWVKRCTRCRLTWNEERQG